MAWTAPATVVAGQLMTAAFWNSHVRDNELHLFSLAWPIGSIFTAAVSTNPATLLGFGTWAAYGTGRVLVAIDGAQTEFDTLDETGGAKTHTLSSAEMPAHAHTQDAHTHTQDAHTHTQDAHTHTQNAHGHTQDAHGHGVTESAHDHDGYGTGSDTTIRSPSGGWTFGGTLNEPKGVRTRSTGLTVNNATATNQAATATNQNATATNQAATATNQNATATNQSTGGGGAHNTLPPYIVVYRWKRTA